MAFKERKPAKAVEVARQRIEGVKLIDEKKKKTINYGEDESLTIVEYQAQYDLCEKLNSSYNQSLKESDALGNQLDEAEDKLKDMNSRILLGAKGKFTADADEIELLGGTKTSDRKKPVKKQPAAK